MARPIGEVCLGERRARVRKCKNFHYKVFYSSENKGYVARVVHIVGMDEKKRGISTSTFGSRKEVAARRLREHMADLLTNDRDLFFGKERA